VCVRDRVDSGDADSAGAGLEGRRPRARHHATADHASHPDYKIEWWYYTGNLDATDGRRFGYQLTFFRIGIDPAPANPSI
jgi:predicted secreted hydrolase